MIKIISKRLINILSIFSCLLILTSCLGTPFQTKHLGLNNKDDANSKDVDTKKTDKKDDINTEVIIDKKFNLEALTQVGQNFFGSTTSSKMGAIVKDAANNIYLAGSFIGELDGVASGNNDALIIKLNDQGTIVWKKHLNSLTFPDYINSTSGDDSITSLLWDKRDDSIYFYGNTTSSFVETNTSSKSNLFWGKLDKDGKLLWLHHRGNISSGKVVAGDSASDLIMSPTNELIMAFTTFGSVFETFAGGEDIGIMKVSSNDGELISGRQLGVETLGGWASLKGINSVNGSGAERNGNRKLVLDGNLIVMPFATTGSLLEPKGTSGSDGAFVVFNADLTLHELKQFGSVTWTTGNVSADDQFRAVVVNGPNDYLFFGKTISDVVETKQLNDFFFVRYKNGSVINVKHYGSTTLGIKGLNNEEARSMIKGDDGKIYCSGHTRSNLFDTSDGNWDIILFRVDENGELLNGIQLGDTAVSNLNFVTVSAVVQGVDFLTYKGKLIMPFSNYPLSTSGPFDTWITHMDLP